MTTSYSYTINFGRYSANISAYNPDTCALFKSQEEAKEYGLKEARRLTTEASGNVTSIEIEKFCVECDGRGAKSVRYGKRVLRWKEVICSVCGGKGKMEVVEVIKEF